MNKSESFFIDQSQSKTLIDVLDKPKTSKKVLGLIKVESGKEVLMRSEIALLAANTQHFTNIAVIASGTAVVNIDENIVIEKSATNSQAFLKVVILIITGHPKITVLPKMEVKTNTAQASHAVSTIKLTGESLFYAKTRGLLEKDLKELLIKNIMEQYGR